MPGPFSARFRIATGATFVGVLFLALAACNGAEPTPSPLPDSTPAPTPGSAADTGQLPDDPRGLLAATLESTFPGGGPAIRKMGNSGDESYIPVLVEILRFWWRLYPEVRIDLYSALGKLIEQPYEQLSPEQLEPSWWVEWVGSHPEVQPPEGFAAWKGQLYSNLVDPEMGAFLYEGVKARIRVEEIIWGGVRKDGIPDLTNPPVVSAEEATYLGRSDRVFGVSINGEHRAYPLRILNAHEMANDVVGGVPFALAY